MAQPALQLRDDVCPSCGRLARLVEITGWCPQCTLAHDPTIKVCPCGALFFKGKKPTTKCWNCRKEEYLTRYADELEHYLSQGLGIKAAKKQVAHDVRPLCINCGNPIKGGRDGNKFCRTKPECKKKAENYTALKLTGLSPDVALAIAVGRVAVLS